MESIPLNSAAVLAALIVGLLLIRRMPMPVLPTSSHILVIWRRRIVPAPQPALSYKPRSLIEIYCTLCETLNEAWEGGPETQRLKEQTLQRLFAAELRHDTELRALLGYPPRDDRHWSQKLPADTVDPLMPLADWQIEQRKNETANGISWAHAEADDEPEEDEYYADNTW